MGRLLLWLLGAGDAASVGGIIGCVWGGDVASLDAGGIDELAPAWPQGGAFTRGLDGGGSGRA